MCESSTEISSHFGKMAAEQMVGFFDHFAITVNYQEQLATIDNI